MKRLFILGVFFLFWGVMQSSAQPSMKPDAAATSGFYTQLAFGLPLPVGRSAGVLNIGYAPLASVGYRFALGPGWLGLGLDLGGVIESTQNLPQIDQYTSAFLPAGAVIGYALRVAGGGYAFADVETGFSPTLVFYQLSSLGSLGVWTPYAGGDIGAGFATGRFRIQAGARLFSVFYGADTYMSIAPEIGAEVRW